MSLKIIKTTFLIFITSHMACYGSKTNDHLANIYQHLAKAADSTNKFVPGTSQLKEGHYVVVGAFAKHSNAVNYTEYIINKGYDTNYGVRNDKDYYYVYLYHSNTWEQAVKKTYQVREDVELHDAWVMRVGTNENIRIPEEELQKAHEAIAANHQVDEPDVLEKPEEATEEPAVTEEAASDNSEVKKEKIEGDYILFANTYRSKDKKPLPTNIQLVDNQRAKLIRQIKSNELQGIWDPRNGTSSVKLICGLFGYRKLEHDIKLKEPLTDSTRSFIKIEDGVINIDFKMERLKPGDIAVMYNVYFFNDAAIMRPESKFEVNSLLEMLEENEKMKIKIHGHTNGGKPGRIVKLGKDQKNFFSMSKENIEGFGTAKDLSAERGEAIKRYLIENGINEKRLFVKGWGGKRMLYDRNTPQAKKNIRVEIEILQD
ncbi:OmpA family protein [Fulvivirgaceae bacterium BMA12]|uniref:OmpA family protein n=1 Tax=Agaribacillus aureus TaxID=3051825 RepID=A0ABT8L340_9BACT|nr:OmpA family protein [Fulvivirgaceae bacterium BMA12]